MAAHVRYRAINTGALRALYGCIGVAICLPLVATAGVFLIRQSWMGLLIAALCVLGMLVVASAVVVSTRLQFIVDDEGLTVRGYLRTVRIPWQNVQVIEQVTDYWMMGAVQVVMKDPPGERITASATTDRLAIYRGESPVGWESASTMLRPATAAAIDAHQRWLTLNGSHGPHRVGPA